MWLVVKCPYCGKVSIYQWRRGKIMRKTCPYCKKTFTLTLKTKPSWDRVLGIFDDPKQAREFMLSLQQ